MNRSAVTCGGCVLSVAGALAATALWLTSPRTRIHLGHGFEDEGLDLSVLVTELPLVFLAGALLPVLVYAPLARLLTGGSGSGNDGSEGDG
ncbi:hypothetical protein SAMN04487983_1007106 [Streptomyces sp. yr375]|uniref:hypothetical protein n=1 Tax=Streptomyces sp. yr375 TaxID=1761906 RepID=UPI0008C1B33E|nr:hypothetical protein [Streptomyces sp. yr375]SEQ69366.1 hypothetical protein SAMN04487983_1007106 [Streptomyces sp. yr375]